MEQQEIKLDIPPIFQSDAEEKPFETCVVCGKDLLHSQENYMVEKVFKTYEGHDFKSTVFEFAICTTCHQKMQEGMSEESMQNMQNYYQQFIQQRGSDSIMIDLRTFDVNQWLSKCFFKSTPVSEMKEYQVVGMFKGDKLILNQPPMVIGYQAMEEMAELLSKQTRDEMNGFREKFLGPPPEFSEFIYGKKLIMV
ncbi:MAG: hypothetical protein DRJ09_04715 [Bacteroidetes bacterium]|nr:MAG: hypothetical protein DRJ09_04715 [Bacteroidota bacterium]